MLTKNRWGQCKIKGGKKLLKKKKKKKKLLDNQG